MPMKGTYNKRKTTAKELVGRRCEDGVSSVLKRLKVRWYRVRYPTKAGRYGQFVGDIDVVFYHKGRLYSIECKNWPSRRSILPSEFYKQIVSRFVDRFIRAQNIAILAGVKETPSLKAALDETGIKWLFTEPLQTKTDEATAIFGFFKHLLENETSLETASYCTSVASSVTYSELNRDDGG